MKSLIRTVGMAVGLTAGLCAAETDRTPLYDRLGGMPAVRAVVEDLVATLDKLKVPEKEKQQLLGLLGPLKAAIVQQ
jgi:hypothetical protein